MINLKRLKSVIKKEVIQIRRDRASMIISFVLPIMMLLVFGYAVNTNIEHIETVVWNQSPSLQSRELINSFGNSQIFDINYYADNYQELQKYIDSGKAGVAIVIPPNYTKELRMGRSTEVQVIIDGSDPLKARTALAGAQNIIQISGVKIKTISLNKTGMNPGNLLPIEAKTRVWFNPDMESIKFNIPGLIGIIMQNITIMLTAFSMVRERERGTLEQLIITPVRPIELIIGKLTPYIFIAFFDIIIALLIGTYWFNVDVKGSIILLLFEALIFLISALGLGMLISTVAKTQLQAMQMSFAVLLPSILLSGFMFPRESMPIILKSIGYIFPITYFLEILRGIILKGIGLNYLWQNTLILILFGIFILSLAALRFNKKLD